MCVCVFVSGEEVEQCEEEEDDVWGIEWDSTDEGDTDEQDCPRPNDIEEVTGMFLRERDPDESG